MAPYQASSSSTSAHIRKRPFQPSITSYLTRSVSSSSHASQLHHSPSSTPALPEDMQASLLNVGMRVRKSVPEGYKTCKPAVESSGFSSSVPVAPVTRSTSSPVHTARAGRELMPFCGLHKTGGLASSAPPERVDEWEEGMPGLGWSQDTYTSTQESTSAGTPGIGTEIVVGMAGGRGVGGAGTKRGFEEEMEEEMDAFFEEVGEEEAVAVAHRKFARPRGGRKNGEGEGGDFEDAAFLAPMDVDEM
ncbi:hypothetical protein B0A50_04777 [Salinomyces thailandicus]|uniref:Uncharacterized protein n=1 Tax=Salinomyces thailandicus TaxID=706561 RepID=A0A4V6WJR6_9PEZI|nr:hypothetical protein B0A50_04777 [Salinomyces thailandica]